jgi:hypothetical protein
MYRCPSGLLQEKKDQGVTSTAKLFERGEMPERPKGHDWKSCVPTKIGTEGSNPSLSATHHVRCVASPKPYVV